MAEFKTNLGYLIRFSQETKQNKPTKTEKGRKGNVLLQVVRAGKVETS